MKVSRCKVSEPAGETDARNPSVVNLMPRIRKEVAAGYTLRMALVDTVPKLTAFGSRSVNWNLLGAPSIWALYVISACQQGLTSPKILFERLVSKLSLSRPELTISNGC